MVPQYRHTGTLSMMRGMDAMRHLRTDLALSRLSLPVEIVREGTAGRLINPARSATAPRHFGSATSRTREPDATAPLLAWQVRRVLVGTVDRGARLTVQVDLLRRLGLGEQGGDNPVPGAVATEPAMPLPHRLPLTERLR